jgi:hypothetical protein
MTKPSCGPSPAPGGGGTWPAPRGVTCWAPPAAHALGRLAVVIRSAMPRKPPSAKRVRRLSELESPRSRAAGAPGSAAGRDARARLAAAVHRGQNTGAGRERALAHYWNTRPAFERTHGKKL